MNRHWSTWAHGVLLLALALGLFFAASLMPSPRHDIEQALVHNSLGRPLRVVLFLPERLASQSGPGVVLCQPLNNPPEFAEPLAMELVRDGFVVLVFDWRGRSSEENRQTMRSSVHQTLRADCAAAVSYLRGHAEVDPERVGIAGHSVGGSLAIDAGVDDSRLMATVCIGMETEVPPGKPKNLLWAAGLYDEFRGPVVMRAAYEASGGESNGLDVTGDFERGTARGLFISPTADHFTELFDWRLQRAVGQWFRRAAGLPDSSHPYLAELRCLLNALAWVMALAGALVLARRVAGGGSHAIRLVNAAVLLIMILLGASAGRIETSLANLALTLVIFVPVNGLVSLYAPGELRRGLWRVFRIAATLWASVVLTLFVNAIPTFVSAPRMALYFPEFTVRLVLDWLYAYGFLYPRQILFVNYAPAGHEIRLWVYCLLIAELAVPGGLMRLACTLGRRLRKKRTDRRSLSKVHIAFLGALLAALACIVWLRLAQGFMTAESTRAALVFIGRFSVVPIGLFLLLWRLTAKWGWGGHAPTPRRPN